VKCVFCIYTNFVRIIFCHNEYLASYLRDVLSKASRSARKMFITVARLEGKQECVDAFS